MKILLPKSVCESLIFDAAQEKVADDPRDPSGFDYDSICAELSRYDIDKNGYINLSRSTFDWVVSTLVSAYSPY